MPSPPPQQSNDPMEILEGGDTTAKAYRSIRRMILDGGLPPGHRMSHRNLSEQLGIGRSPVRDAILQLETEGLVVQRGQKGILLRELSPKELGELYEIRLVLEPFFAERAALHADFEHIGHLRRICDELSAVMAQPDLAVWFHDEANRRRFAQCDMQFHSTILEAAGNSFASRIFGTAQVLALLLGWYLLHTDDIDVMVERSKAAIAEHEAVFHAIQARDSAAARERMREHVQDAILFVPQQYAAKLRAEADAAERAAAQRAAAAVRGSRA
jgi:DNA-binding GntR family transcriptional regulator